MHTIVTTIVVTRLHCSVVFQTGKRKQIYYQKIIAKHIFNIFLSFLIIKLQKLNAQNVPFFPANIKNVAHHLSNNFLVCFVDLLFKPRYITEQVYAFIYTRFDIIDDRAQKDSGQNSFKVEKAGSLTARILNTKSDRYMERYTKWS